MAVQSPITLEEEVHGSRVRDQFVEVKVKALLHNLGGDQDVTASLRFITVGTEMVEDGRFNPKTVSLCKARMEKDDFAWIPPAGLDAGAELESGLDSISDGVSDPTGAAALPGD